MDNLNDKQVSIHIGTKAVIIDAYSYEFVPSYLWYLFEAKDIPRNKMLVFYDGNYEFNEFGNDLNLLTKV